MFTNLRLLMLLFGSFLYSHGLRDSSFDYPVPPILEKCYLLINEINLSTQSESAEYVELKLQCPPEFDTCVKVDMTHFKLIFISATGFIETACALSNTLTYDGISKPFYTVAKGELPNKDFDFGNCSKPAHVNTFPTGSSLPIGLGLIYSKDHFVLETVDLVYSRARSRLEPRNISVEIEDIIVKTLQDFYVLSDSSPVVFCDCFKKYVQFYDVSNFPLLRDWHNDQNIEDRSISRCGGFAPFEHQSMYLASPTPNSENSCKSAFKNNFGLTTKPKLLSNVNGQTNCYRREIGYVTRDMRWVIARPQVYNNAIQAFYTSKLEDNAVVVAKETALANPGQASSSLRFPTCNTVTADTTVNETITVEPTNLTTTMCTVCATCFKGKYIHSFLAEMRESELNPDLGSTEINNDGDKTGLIHHIRHHSKRHHQRNRRSKSKYCFFQFSELNSMSAHAAEGEFIEFRRKCGPQATIRGYPNMYLQIVVFIEVLEIPVISFIGRLSLLLLQKQNDREYIGTIGNKQYNNAGLKFDHADIQFSSEDPTNILPDGTKSLVIAVLIEVTETYYNSKELHLIKNPNTNMYMPLELSQSIKTVIQTKALDMIVYAGQPLYDNCNLVEELRPSYARTDYVLRDWQQQLIAGEEYSLARCGTIPESFAPDAFKLDLISPGIINHCNLAVQFLLPREINRMAPLVSVHHTESEASDSDGEVESNQPHCSRNKNLKRPIDLITSAEYEQKLVEKRTKFEGTLLQYNPNNVNFGKKVEKVLELDKIVKLWNKELQENPMAELEFPWESTKDFNPAWVQVIKNYQRDLLNPDVIQKPTIKPWFDYLINEEDVQTYKDTHYRCRFCNSYFESDQILDREGELRRRNVMLKTGYLFKGGNAIEKNSRMLEEHPHTPVHEMAVSYLMERTINIQESNLEKSGFFATEVQAKYFDATSNLFRIVYFQMRNNIPCHAHPSFHNLLTYYKVNIGTHFYDENYCRKIKLSIRDDMHKLLVTSLVTQNKPFTVLIDSATVGPRFHFLLFMIRTIENSAPVTYMYRLIEIGLASDAQGTFDAMKLAIENDGPEFTAYFKAKCVGYSSDGASVVRSSVNGVLGKLISYINNKNIYTFHCISHKNQLIFRNVVQRYDLNSDYVRRLESAINSLHNFYSSRAYKRNAELRKFVEDLNGDFYSLKSIFVVRWVTSERKALDSLFKMWSFVIDDLKRHASNRFDAASKVKAEELLAVFLDRTSIITLAFLYDVTEVFSRFSLETQTRNKVIVGVQQTIENLRESLITLKQDGTGAFLSNYLSTVFCDNYVEGECTVQLYDNAKIVTYKGVQLYDQDTEPIPTFKFFRIQFLNNLIEELATQFSDQNYNEMDIFDPLLLPTMKNPNSMGVPENIEEISDYGNAHFVAISKKLGITDTDENIRKEWQKLKESIISCLPMYETLRNSDPEKFWKFLLISKSVEWTSTTRLLIEGILSLSVSTAIVESTFSVAAHIADKKKRANLLSNTIEALLGVRVNSKVHWSKWNPTYYVKSWLQKGHIRADDTAHNIPSKKKYGFDNESDDEDFEELAVSSIF